MCTRVLFLCLSRSSGRRSSANVKKADDGSEKTLRVLCQVVAEGTPNREGRTHVGWLGERTAGIEKEATMAKDVVCGMQVDEKTTATSVYKGTTYHFCSPGCKKAFDAAPEKYAGKAKS